MARTKRPRTHNEWFRPVERGGRKSCSHCHVKLEPGEWIWSWGQYINAKFHNIRDVCKNCWHEVAEALLAHERDCPENCTIELQVRGASQPTWMKLERQVRCEAGVAVESLDQDKEMVLAANGSA